MTSLTAIAPCISRCPFKFGTYLWCFGFLFLLFVCLLSSDPPPSPPPTPTLPVEKFKQHLPCPGCSTVEIGLAVRLHCVRRVTVSISCSSSVLTSLSGEGTCSMYVRPPRVATYLLKIMGRGQGQDSTAILHLLLSYVIR